MVGDVSLASLPVPATTITTTATHQNHLPPHHRHHLRASTIAATTITTTDLQHQHQHHHLPASTVPATTITTTDLQHHHHNLPTSATTITTTDHRQYHDHRPPPPLQPPAHQHPCPSTAVTPPPCPSAPASQLALYGGVLVVAAYMAGLVGDISMSSLWGAALLLAVGLGALAAGLPLLVLPAPLFAALGLGLFLEARRMQDYLLFTAGCLGTGGCSRHMVHNPDPKRFS